MSEVTKKHPGRVAQGHKLAALMKKRKEEMLQNKPEQSTVLSTEQSKEQSTEQSTVLSTEQSTEQSSVLSSQTLIILGLVGIGVAGIYIFKTPEKQITEPKKPKTYM